MNLKIEGHQDSVGEGKYGGVFYIHPINKESRLKMSLKDVEAKLLDHERVRYIKKTGYTMEIIKVLLDQWSYAGWTV